MKTSYENPSKASAVLTVVVEPDDYKADVEKALKDVRRRANMPGFRPGQVPMGMIRRQYGASAKMDAVNKFLGETINNYLKENKISILGHPLANKEQEPQDLEKDGELTFKFDLALEPEFKAELSKDDKIDYYTVAVDDKTIDEQVDMYASRAGNYAEVEKYTDGDMLKGELRELGEDGMPKEGGLTVDDAVLMPKFIKVDEQRTLFDACGAGDIITFSPRKAYPDNDTEVSSLLKIDRADVAQHEGDFTYQITEIKHFEKAAVNQALFDQVLGKDVVSDEQAFRAKVGETLMAQYGRSSDYQFLRSVEKYMAGKVGKLDFDRDMLVRLSLENNKEKTAEDIEKHMDESLAYLQWELTSTKLCEANGVKLTDDDVRTAAKEYARMQFEQYGMSNVPEEYIDNYAADLLKKDEERDMFVRRAIDSKLTSTLKEVVTLDEKTVSPEEFNKIVNGQ